MLYWGFRLCRGAERVRPTTGPVPAPSPGAPGQCPCCLGEPGSGKDVAGGVQPPAPEREAETKTAGASHGEAVVGVDGPGRLHRRVLGTWANGGLTGSANSSTPTM